jgi:NitT/TauT family transport system ATP-binding protein
VTSALTIQNVTKRFADGTHALGPVSLDIQPQTFTALLGPSGCGKSTLLRLIAGLAPPSSGSIQFAGPAPKFGFVFQEATLMPWRRVAENVALPLELTGQHRADFVQSCLARVGLSDFANAYPRQLSGGMRMRVSIARALAAEPDMMLMDEPFAALDEITRGALNADLLSAWAESRFTALFVTHSVYESVFLAERIVVMSKRPGHIVDDIWVDAPYPRTEDWRLAPEFAQIVRRVSQALHGGMA